jgi:hypothetical protein
VVAPERVCWFESSLGHSNSLIRCSYKAFLLPAVSKTHPKNIDVFEMRGQDFWIQYHCAIEGKSVILIELDENADWISVTGQRSSLISQIGSVIESYAA